QYQSLYCCFFTCRLYEYHFIEENKSWYEAQRYCREKYTDLAKVFDMTDMSRLRNSAQNQGEAWIGLNNTGGNRMWHWSLPGVKYIHNDSSWNLNGRTEKSFRRQIIEGCYRVFSVGFTGMKKDKKTLHLIETFMNWTQAQSYCRYNHTDLASGPDQVDGEEMKTLFNGRPMSVWMGLFRDSWRWSDGSDFSFRYWDMQLFNDEQNTKTCDALNYCENNYKGLVSITNPEVQGWVQEKAKGADSPYVWIGLSYKCTLGLWLWVSDYVVCYDKWATEGKTEGCDMSVGVDRGGQHEWFSRRNNETYNFICSKW
uniref:C-type lectin domain-containing protein n=1 Tax=Neolamprologus brichardi TaxID=32507 RepID=A0A3Q4GDM9_NEOBR